MHSHSVGARCELCENAGTAASARRRGESRNPAVRVDKRVTEAAIQCRDLHKHYVQRKKQPVHALRGLDLTVHRGECFGLLGPNGAGKTTTVEILEGLLAPSSGHIEVLGMHWDKSEHALRQRIGISLQETRLTDKITALETLRLFRSFYKKGMEPEQALGAVQLEEKRDAWVNNLSGGQRQRLAVACALVGEPELLFLDEPTTGLDPQARRDVWNVIRAQRERGCTTLLTTHYMDEAERLSDRIAVVDHGKVIALGTPRELIASLGGEHVIELSLENGDDQPMADAELTSINSVRAVQFVDGAYVLTVEHVHLVIPELLRFLEARVLTLSRLTTRHASLEDVFVSLTGRHLSDDE